MSQSSAGGPESGSRGTGATPSFARLIAIFAGGNIISAVLRTLGGVLTARFVAPEVLGFFNGAGLLLAYAPTLFLGVISGLGREIPYQRGRGRADYAAELAAAAQVWALGAAALVSLVALGMALRYALQGNVGGTVVWVTNAATAVLLLYGQFYLEATFRTAGEFARLSVVNVAQSVLSLALVPLIAVTGLYGLCARQLTVAALNWALLWRSRPIRVGPCWRWSHVVHLQKIGLPIFAVGELWRLWTVLDQTLVLAQVGHRALGLYALATMTSAPLFLLVNSVSQIIYPRMSERYGRTHRLRDLYTMCVRPTLGLTAVVVPGVVAGWFLLPPVARAIVPQYVEGIPAAQWALLAQGVLALRPPVNILNVVRRQDLALAGVIAGVIAYVAALFLLQQAGPRSLVHFPQAMLVGNTAYLATNYLFLSFLSRRPTPPAATA